MTKNVVTDQKQSRSSHNFLHFGRQLFFYDSQTEFKSSADAFSSLTDFAETEPLETEKKEFKKGNESNFLGKLLHNKLNNLEKSQISSNNIV